jgi:hypothetical protein
MSSDKNYVFHSIQRRCDMSIIQETQILNQREQFLAETTLVQLN